MKLSLPPPPPTPLPPPPPGQGLVKADDETNQRNQRINNSMKSIDYFQSMIMYQSIPRLTITPDDPEDSHVLTAWGIGILNQSRFFTVFRDKLLDLFQKKKPWRQLQTKCSCAVSCQLLQKQ